MAYTRLKRFVDSLKKEGILNETEVGTAKVLTVINLERAIELGYLSGDLDKLQSWSVLPFL